MTIIVHRPEDKPDPLSLPVGKTVFATPAWRSTLIRPTPEDTPGTQIVTVEGLPISPGQSVPVLHGHVVLTPKGALSFNSDPGWQMEPIWLPAPEAVAARFWEMARNGYQNTALWIMVIVARSGASAVRLAKVHAAYSLGASRMQVLRHILIPNSLPEIFTGLRVALGVCWGTVVAAELVAAEKGAGMMILVASKFQLTDIVVMGIILIGIIGYTIDILMRWAEALLVPWKGRG